MASNKRQKQGHVEADEAAASESTSLKGTFIRELMPMMYAFGDDESPLPETVDLVEDIVIEYASGVLRKSMDAASLRGKSKPPLKGVGAVTAEDIMAVCRKDSKKYDRVKELFELQKDIKFARSLAEDPGVGDTEALKNLAKDLEAGEDTNTLNADANGS